MIELLQRLLNSFQAFFNELYSVPAPWTLGLMDWVNISTSAGTILAVLVGVWALRQNSQARNLSIVVEMTGQLAEMRERMHQDGLFSGTQSDPAKINFRTYQMLHLLECAAFIVNKKLTTGKARKFLLEWLEVEAPTIDVDVNYKTHLDKTSPGELGELKILLIQFRLKRAKIEARSIAKSDAEARNQAAMIANQD